MESLHFTQWIFESSSRGTSLLHEQVQEEQEEEEERPHLRLYKGKLQKIT